MAARLGWRTRLGDVLPRLTCKTCGAPPRSLVLIDNVMERARWDGRPKMIRLL